MTMPLLDWWVPDEPLDPREVERFAILANQTVTRWRAVGGKLIATDRRLLFRPNRIDRALGGRIWSVPLSAVTAVTRKPPTFNPFDGGLRSRLRIATVATEHLFVVNALDEQVARVTTLLG